jgi:hypothetical protein
VTSRDVLLPFFYGSDNPQLGLKTDDKHSVFHNLDDIRVRKDGRQKDVLLFAPAAKGMVFSSNYHVDTISTLPIGISSTRIPLRIEQLASIPALIEEIVITGLVDGEHNSEEVHKARCLELLYSFISTHTFTPVMEQQLKADKLVPPLLAKAFHQKHGNAYPYHCDHDNISWIIWMMDKEPVSIISSLLYELLLLAPSIGTLKSISDNINRTKGPVITDYDTHPLLSTLRNLVVEHNTTKIPPVIQVHDFTVQTCTALHVQDDTTNLLLVNRGVLALDNTSELMQIVYEFLCSHVNVVQFVQEANVPSILSPLQQGKKRKPTNWEEVLPLLMDDSVKTKKAKIIELV